MYNVNMPSIKQLNENIIIQTHMSKQQMKNNQERTILSMQYN